MRIVPSRPCGSQGANFTAGVRERADANRTREAGDSILVKIEILLFFPLDPPQKPEDQDDDENRSEQAV